jgi:outer membrane receptor protein involved in Fe transport
MARKFNYFLPICALVFSLFSFTSHAQTSKATLAGIVRDKSGAVVSNANVKVSNQETGETRQTESGGDGQYRVEAINPGTYTIRVEAQGFDTFNLKDLVVRASVVTSYDAVLDVGQVSQTVEVEANSNNVNTDNGQLSSVVGSKELAALPIFSLNPIELVATLPGVQYVNPMLNLGGSGGNYEQIEVNGARPRANNFMMDGQDINDVGLGGQAFQPQIPDIFQSVVALTNSPSAEYGRAGGAVVNLITKAGTNRFHGSAFELYQGSGLNALDGQTRRAGPFAPGTPNPKARFDIHNFGFTAGGPVWKDKLFLFGASQWSRFYGNSQSTPIELPDAAGYATLTSIGGPNVALLQGLLNSGSYLGQYTVQGPGEVLNAGQPSTGNPNVCPATGCLVSTAMFERPPVPQKEPDTQYMVRGDYIPRQQDTIAIRYLHDNSTFTPDLSLNTSGLPGFDGEVGGPSQLAFGNWTHIFSPSLLNEFRVSMTRINFLFQATPETKANPLSDSYNLNFTDNSMPELGISQNIPQGRKENFYQFQDTVGWTIGKQSLRIGADVGRILETDIVAQNALGGLNIAAGTQSGLANYLNNNLGPSGTATRTFGPTRFDPHIWRSAGFVQDDIKIIPQLTLNLGLRYDYLTDPSNSLPFPGIDIEDPFAPITNVYKINTDHANWGPRFGFAYAPSGVWLGKAGETVFHGGIGIFYDTDFSNIPVNSAQAAPNATSTTLISNTGNGLGNALGLIASIQPGPVNPLSSVQSADKNLVNPRTYQWNLGFERALPAQLKLTVNYVGSRGRKLYGNQQYNYFGPTALNGEDPGSRLNPDRGAINARANTVSSQYDSIQTEVSKQFSHGLFFRGTYTFGKNLDNGSEVFALFNNPGTSYSANLAPGGRRQDWGPSAFNFPSFFSLSYVWAPAGLRASDHRMDAFLGGATRHWTISGLTQLQSGVPGTFAINGLDTNLDGNPANDRPLVGNSHAPIDSAGIDGFWLGATPGVYYDLAQNNQTNAVVPVDPSQVHWLVPHGAQFLPFEVGRNSFKNPGSTIWNLAVQKDIPTPWFRLEGSAFQLRAEATDVGNHNDVGVLDTNVLQVGSSNYTNISNARASTARNLRFWIKFAF